MTHLAHWPNLDPSQQSPLATPFSFNLLSLTSGTGLSATSSLIPSHFFPHSAGADPPGRAASAPNGTAGRPAGTNAEPTRARELLENLQGGRPSYPSRHAGRGSAGQGHKVTSPPQPCVQSHAPNTFALASPRPGGLYPKTRHPLATHLPALGFCPFPLFAVAKGEEKGGGGGEGGEEQRSAAAPGHRRRAKAGYRNRRHDERRAGRLRWGRSRTGNRNVHATVNIYTAENTFAMPPPTPSRPRLHHRPNVSTTVAILLFPPSLVSFQCWTGDVEARHRYPYPACVLAIEPQPYRAVTGRSSWTRHVPRLTVAVRRASEIAGLRVELVLLQGTLCAAAPPRVAPMVTRRLRRAGEARPRVP
jgi:hypothetical protein